MFFAPWPREGPEFFHVIEDYRPEELYPSSLLSFPPPPPRLIAKLVPLNAQRKSSGHPLENRYTVCKFIFLRFGKEEYFSIILYAPNPNWQATMLCHVKFMQKNVVKTLQKHVFYYL